MENFETENYLIEVIGEGHRIVDKCQGKATPIDKSPENYQMLKDIVNCKRQIFDFTCENLIKYSGAKL